MADGVADPVSVTARVGAFYASRERYAPPRHLRLLFAACCLLAAPAALAEEYFDYQAGVGAGNRSIDFELTGEPSGNLRIDADGNITPLFQASNVKFSFEESLPTAIFSGSLIHRNFYLNLNLELPAARKNADLDILVEPAAGPGLPLNLDDATEYELDRVDFVATCVSRTARSTAGNSITSWEYPRAPGRSVSIWTWTTTTDTAT